LHVMNPPDPGMMPVIESKYVQVFDYGPLLSSSREIVVSFSESPARCCCNRSTGFTLAAGTSSNTAWR